MGQGQSRSQDDDFFVESGVRITQGLLEQLEGKPRRPAAAAAAGAATATPLRPRSEDPDAAASAALVARDRSLGRALERSRRVGNLLLKTEGEELQRVDALAAELVAREYSAPSRPRPCRQQADDCVRCYADHADDPLACSAAVEAYSACARAAWQEVLERGAGP